MGAGRGLVGVVPGAGGDAEVEAAQLGLQVTLQPTSNPTADASRRMGLRLILSQVGASVHGGDHDRDQPPLPGDNLDTLRRYIPDRSGQKSAAQLLRAG